MSDAKSGCSGGDAGPKYHGLYRATVADNRDPLQIGRIRAVVPDVSNTIPTTWALPCTPLSGAAAGIFVVPQIGARVWLMFEQGDADYPVWIGGFWGSQGERPPLATAGLAGVQVIVLQTAGGNGVALDDQPGAAGGIKLKGPGGAQIVLDNDGIKLTKGTRSLQITADKVAINDTALEVR